MDRVKVWKLAGPVVFLGLLLGAVAPASDAPPLSPPRGFDGTPEMALARLHGLLAEVHARIREVSPEGEAAARWFALEAEILAALEGRHEDPARWARSARVAGLLARGGAARPNGARPVGVTGSGGTISGTVVDAVTGAPVRAYLDLYDTSGYWLSGTSTDASGQYAFNFVSPGAYHVRTTNSAGYIDEVYDDIPCPSCDVTIGTVVNVTDGGTTTVDFALTPGAQIHGTVTAAGSGDPLPSTNISIYNSAGSYVTSGYTNASGAYSSYSGLLAGTYYAKTRNSSGHIDELYDDLPCVGFCDVTSGTPIPVTAGVDKTGIDFALSPGGLISGQITDAATGLPLENVGVQLYDDQGDYVTWGYSNASGNYTSSSGLPAGTYYAQTYNTGSYVQELYDDISCFWCSVTSGTPIAVTLGSTTTGIDFALSPGGLISGQVTAAATGLPLEDVGVDLYDTQGVYVSYAYTDPDGSYMTYSGLPAGTYYAQTYNWTSYVNELYDDISCPGWCDVTSGTPIVVTVGSTTTGIDFALSLGGLISGQVTDAATGLPLPNVTVWLYDALGDYASSGHTSASGTYLSHSGLPVGNYYAQSYDSKGYVNELYDDIPCLGGCDVTTGTPIAVTAGSTTMGVDFALSPGGQIAGEVTDAATGLPLQYVSVSLYDAQSVYVGGGSSGADGGYKSNGLPAGTYYARTFNSGGYIDELYDDMLCLAGCDVTSGTPIAVTVGALTTGTDFALAFDQPPFGSFDTPVDGSVGVTGAIPVTGWALDDGGVTKVEIYRDPMTGEPTQPNGKVYVGDGTFIAGARPDVAAAYPGYPNADRAGWGYMLLTNFLPDNGVMGTTGGNGSFTLHAYANDIRGHATLLDSKAITCTNASATRPFGTIDTPAQGETISGTIQNWAWALTPQPASIPTDGSTLWVYVDGVPLGHPTYNLYRADIATLFPGYANTDGAVGYFVLDTTTLANGIHSLAWSVTDSLGRTEGIGSRYFWVQN